MRKYTRMIAMLLCVALTLTEMPLNVFAGVVKTETQPEIAGEESFFLTEDPTDDPEYWKYNGEETEEINSFLGDIEPEIIADVKTSRGIDVSTWQGDINWNQVKSSGIEFAIIRAGYRGSKEGTLNTDKKFSQNMNGAINAGVPVGVYFYTEAINTSEAVEEANYVLGLIKGYKISLPVTVDFEPGTNGGRQAAANLSKEQATAICKAFCDTVKAAGYDSMVYANKSDLSSRLDAGALASSNKIWLAQYNSQVTYSGAYNFWQYSSSGNVNGISGNVDMDLWYPASHSITYKLDGGTNNSQNPARYFEGEEYTLYDAVKDGYIFKGWYLDSSFSKKTTKISSDMRTDITLYAKWELDAYIIKYDSNAKSLNRKEKGSTENSYFRFEDTKCELRANGYSLDGYKFKCWNTRADGQGKSFGDSSNKGKVEAGDYFLKQYPNLKRGDEIKLYAQWEPVYRQVTLYKNDGSGIEETTTCVGGDTISDIIDLESEKWSKPGYQLAYWTKGPEDKGKKYITVAESLFKKKNSETSLFAQWKIKTYKVTYNLDGGKNDKRNPKKYRIDYSDITLYEPVKKGFTFEGWQDQNGNIVTGIKNGSYGDLKLTALWKENVYYINYHITDMEYVTVSMNTITVSYNYTGVVNMSEIAQMITIKDEHIDLLGIAAFNTKEKGKGKSYSVAKSYKGLTTEDGAVIDLYTKWGGASFGVNYYLDGGSNNAGNKLSYKYNPKKAYKVKSPKKTGFIFKGWKAVSGNEIAFDEGTQTIVKGAKGNINLLATWEPVTYTVKFNLNTKDKSITSTGSMQVDNVKYASTVSQNYLVGIKYPEYYRLKCFATKPSGKGLTVSPNSIGEVELSGLCKKNGGKVTLYAIWEPVEYNITYVNIDPDDATKILEDVVNKNPNTYSYNSKKDMTLISPMKYGFKFEGWYLDKECTQKITSIKKGRYGDITLYAKWSAK